MQPTRTTGHAFSSKRCPTCIRQPGEVVIDVKAASVNFPDVLIIQNKYQFKPPLPFTPGAEFAGIVREVGAGVTQFKPGMRVAAYTAQGAFAEQALREARRACRCPMTSISRAAAAFTLAYGTSYHALVDRGALKAGETLLVLGAAGGVGLAAVADRQGARRARDRGGIERGEARVLRRARRGRDHRLHAAKTCASASRR